ncbi:hypothetical protein MMC31_003375 [Peltigera leucophlebia]|nr:hypothetical protein [Peltigera leucophlebia]
MPLYPNEASLRSRYISRNEETVFYTSGVEVQAAINYARSNGKKTYKDAWPPWLIRRKSKNLSRYRQFALIFREILAEKAVGTAWVLAPASLEDPGKLSKLPPESVWVL